MYAYGKRTLAVPLIEKHKVDVPSDGNGKVEDGKHDGPLLIGVEVSQDGRRDRGEAGLAETDRRAEKEERPETLQ